MKRHSYSIDILKAICCFLVIVIHVPWNFKEQVIPFARCSVPCFFMISGFLLYQDGGIELNRIKRTFKSVFKITLWSSLLFLLWTEWVNISDNNSLFIPTIRNIFSWIFCNNYPFSYHQWYLYAYLYVLIIVFFVEKYRKWNLLFYSIPVLLSISVVFYIFPFLKIEYPIPVFRNFLFIGLPFFAIGSFIKSKYNTIIQKININFLIWCGIILVISTTCEPLFLKHIGEDLSKEIYISTPFLSIILLLMFLSIDIPTSNLFSTIGKQHSLQIYIFHPIFIYVVFKISTEIGVPGIVRWISPFVVFIVTLFFSLMTRRFIKFIPFHKESLNKL